MLLIFVYTVFALVLLYLGAKYFVKSSVDIALFLHVRPYLIALTVVAFATSMPELITSCLAQLKTGGGDIALGNVIGSNIANIGLVLALSAFIRPIPIKKTQGKKEFLSLVIATGVFSFFLYRGLITRFDGVILLILFVLVYLYQICTTARPDHPREKMSFTIGKDLFLLVLSLGSILLGAELLLTQSVKVALMLHLSERVIGLSMVAIGTSIPELAISLVAAFHKKEEVSLGNVIGSNLFNTLFIVGIASLVSPLIFSESFFWFDLPVMVFFTLLIWAMTFFCRQIGRGQALLIFLFYLGYLSYLFF